LSLSDPVRAWPTALGEAPDDGLTIQELIAATGMRRTWIYDRLQALATTGGAHQVTRGRWRA
jgi:S-DNA-T family DNA segregation ATPase FtsK/SpoIIIE